MANANASVLGQAQVNVAAPNAMMNGKDNTHIWTWALLGFFIGVLLLHYWGSGGLRGSVAS